MNVALRGRRGFLLERSFIKRDSLRGGGWGVLVVGRGGGSVGCGEGCLYDLVSSGYGNLEV